MKLSHLPNTLPLDGAVRIELVEGVPIFRASSLVQGRIEALLIKQKESILTSEEEKELDEYEELDDYLSLVNRMIRKCQLQPRGTIIRFQNVPVFATEKLCHYAPVLGIVFNY